MTSVQWWRLILILFFIVLIFVTVVTVAIPQDKLEQHRYTDSYYEHDLQQDAPIYTIVKFQSDLSTNNYGETPFLLIGLYDNEGDPCISPMCFGIIRPNCTGFWASMYDKSYLVAEQKPFSWYGTWRGDNKRFDTFKDAARYYRQQYDGGIR